MTQVNNKSYAEQLFLDGILEIICENLNSSDITIVLICLEGIENLLSLGEKYFKVSYNE